jgi:hypothetical protein
MNATLDLADATTHIKVVVVALTLALLVVWMSLTAKLTNNHADVEATNLIVAEFV